MGNPLNSFERWFGTRHLKTAAQLLIRMMFGADKLKAEFFLKQPEGNGP